MGADSLRNDIGKPGNDVLLFLISNQEYSEKVREIAGASIKAFRKVCYISLNKPFETLFSSFRSNNIDAGKMIFIDCVTTGGRSPANGPKVFFVSSPNALTDLSISINKVIDEEKIDAIIFDSLSTLLVYQQPSMVIKFSHSIISKLRAAKVKGVFTCLKEDIRGELVKDLSMFVDKIVEVG